MSTHPSHFVVLPRRPGARAVAGPAPTGPTMRGLGDPGAAAASAASTAQAAEAALAQVQVRPLDLQEWRELQQDPGFDVAPAMPLALIRPLDGPAAAAIPDETPWGLDAVGATGTALTGKDIVVAVLDTGIDAGHAAFAHLGDRLQTQNFTQDGPGDTDGHGTHCAGTIFGQPVAGRRIGVAPGVSKALVGKVLGKGADSSSLVRAILWARQGGAHIISMSLGVDYPGYAARLIEEQGLPPELATSLALQGYRDNVRLFDTLADLVQASSFLQQPSVVVAAAGNESRADVDPRFLIGLGVPAAADGFISVGAVGRRDGAWYVAPFSNAGPTLSGPGVDIVSAKVGGGLRALSGTSMATPHVAGVAALWLQHMRASGTPFTADNLRAHLISRAQPLPGLPGGRVGAGLARVP